uniref:Pentacotripeptide-repeat region of PRORP domain-containing protein n=1 Tax=Pseudo-nitzschia australis TaxID=44445 RepID=A0A7S4AK60_9STRA
MVKANTRLSRHRQPTEKSQQGDFFSDAMNERLLSSGQESREEFNLPFHSHNNNIRGRHDTSVPPWDNRAAPPGSVESDPHLSSQQISYPNQHRYHNARPIEANNQWNQYTSESGLSRHTRDANSKNIWSTKRLLPKVSDTSFYSASTNPSIGAFSDDAQHSQFQRSTHENHENSIRDISGSINRLHLKGLSSDSKTTAASISSNNTYSSNTIPGVVAASSGSTGGTAESSLTGQRHQPNYLHCRQHGQSMMNSSAKIYYPTLHAMQQKPPPGFVSEEGNSIYPKNSISTRDNTNRHSNRYQNDSRRGNSKKQIGKRHEGQNTDRKHKTELEDSNRVKGNRHRKNRSKQPHLQTGLEFDNNSFGIGEERSTTSSRAIRVIMNPQEKDATSSGASLSSSNASTLAANRLPLDLLTEDNSQTIAGTTTISSKLSNRAILPSINDAELEYLRDEDDDYTDGDEEDSYFVGADLSIDNTTITNHSKKNDWLLRMNRRLVEVPVGNLDPSSTPISAIMNAWAKTKSSHGASMVEKWLNRAQEEFDAGNAKVVPTNKMFTMAVDAWAKSGEGVSAAQRAETILHHMNKKYQTTGLENLRPTTGIFNAVINAWARSKEKIAPSRAEQILKWMDNLHKANPSIQPDKYTFNTVIHAYAKSGGAGAAKKAQELLSRMHLMNQQGNNLVKPDTITYNVVINSLAKSGGKNAAREAEKLLGKMHVLYENGDLNVKPNVVTYGAVIDAYAKSGEKNAAARADALLAKMIHLNQMDPTIHSDLSPNTYVFNTVINAHAKSKEHDAASKAEEMLMAMNRLHVQGMPDLKPDAFTYTAVIDAWAKSGYRGAAARADQLLDTMESKYLAGDMGLKPNTFTYNAVINALAKSGEPSAAARAERVLHNMVNRHKHGGSDDVKPTTINFNSVLDAWAKSGGGRKAAERAEEILEWMDRLYKSGNYSVRPDTITFNAVLDAWARSGDRMAAHRAEQILDHMDELYREGNQGVKPDTYTYNTLINAHAKSSEKGSAARAEHVLQVMKQRYLDGDGDFKPNTRTHTSVIDAWAKSGEKGAARRAEQILNNMIATFEESGDYNSKPNVHTANAVCNVCCYELCLRCSNRLLRFCVGKSYMLSLY